MLNPLDLRGRRVLVTGASSGIGRETAILLSRLGAGVLLVARDRQRLGQTLNELEGTGHAIEERDLGQYEGIPGWMLSLARSHGGLDGLVHCAGLMVTAPMKTMEAAQVEAMWRVNVMAGLWLAKGYRQAGVNASGGSIVLIASVAGLVGQPAIAAYSGSKAAVIGLTRSLAMELARQRIRVNCIAPGLVATRMSQDFGASLTAEHYAAVQREHPLGMGEPGDVANAVAYLLSPMAKWVTGTTLVVDGGYTAH